MAQDLREFIEVTTVHHVPRREGMPQIMEAKICDRSSLKQICKTSFHSLSSTFRAFFRRKDPVLVTSRDITNVISWLRHKLAQLTSEFGRQRNITHSPTLQLCSHG